MRCLGFSIRFNEVKSYTKQYKILKEKFWESSYTTILDINSKTALYPLFATASLFWKQVKGNPNMFSKEKQNRIWNEIVKKQIFNN